MSIVFALFWQRVMGVKWQLAKLLLNRDRIQTFLLFPKRICCLFAYFLCTVNQGSPNLSSTESSILSPIKAKEVG